MSKLKVAESLIDEVAAVYLEEIIRIVERRLKSASKDLMQSDLGLLTVWEEFCYQLQTDKFDSFSLLENYIYNEISNVLETRPEYQIQLLSYQFMETDNVISIDRERLLEVIYGHLLTNGVDFVNKRLEKAKNY